MIVYYTYYEIRQGSTVDGLPTRYDPVRQRKWGGHHTRIDLVTLANPRPANLHIHTQRSANSMIVYYTYYEVRQGSTVDGLPTRCDPVQQRK